MSEIWCGECESYYPEGVYEGKPCKKGHYLGKNGECSYYTEARDIIARRQARKDWLAMQPDWSGQF